MKVLKFKKAKDFKAKEKCFHCGAVLEIESEDIDIRYMPITGTSYWYVCPVCNDKNMLNDRNSKRYTLFRYTRNIEVKGE